MKKQKEKKKEKKKAKFSEFNRCRSGTKSISEQYIDYVKNVEIMDMYICHDSCLINSLLSFANWY